MTDAEFSRLARGVCADCGGYVANKRALRCANCNRIKRRADKDAKKSETCQLCGKAGVHTRGLCCSCSKKTPCPSCGFLSRRERKCPECGHFYAAPGARVATVRPPCIVCGVPSDYLKEGKCAKCRKANFTGEIAEFFAAGYQVKARIMGYFELDDEPCCTLRLPGGGILAGTPVAGLTIRKEAAL